eukprot:1139479-Pyramimonas_sp.AAC.1
MFQIIRRALRAFCSTNVNCAIREVSLKRACPVVTRVPSRQMRYLRQATTRPLKTTTHCPFSLCAASISQKDVVNSRGQVP